MVRMRNGSTGSIMWVHESRVDEYMRAGHKLALPLKPEPESEKPVKKSSKKKTAKKTEK